MKSAATTAVSELLQFALNARRLKAPGNVVANDAELVAIADLDFLIQRHGLGLAFLQEKNFREIRIIADQLADLPTSRCASSHPRLQ